MTSEDLNDLLNVSIDLETGFKRYLLQLRKRLARSSSRQALDMLLVKLFQKPVHRLNKEIMAVEPGYDDFMYDAPQYEISSDTCARDMLEKIIEYENEHYHFYYSMNDSMAYTDSKETCDTLIFYKVKQIRLTRDVLEELELLV